MKKMMILVVMMVMMMAVGCGTAKKEEQKDDKMVVASVIYDDGSIFEVDSAEVNGKNVTMMFTYNEDGELVDEAYYIGFDEVSGEELVAFCE